MFPAHVLSSTYGLHHVVVTRSFPSDGAWQNTMEPQKPDKSPGPEPEVVER